MDRPADGTIVAGSAGRDGRRRYVRPGNELCSVCGKPRHHLSTNTLADGRKSHSVRFRRHGERHVHLLGCVPIEEAEREVHRALEDPDWRPPRDIEAERHWMEVRAREDLAMLLEVEQEATRLQERVRRVRGEVRRTGVRAGDAGWLPPARYRPQDSIPGTFRRLRAKRPTLHVAAEVIAYDHFDALGWDLYRSGWPDFCAVAPTGHIVAIEVKGIGDRVHDKQRDMAELLRRGGIPTLLAYVVDDKVLITNLPDTPGSDAPLPLPSHSSLDGVPRSPLDH